MPVARHTPRRPILALAAYYTVAVVPAVFALSLLVLAQVGSGHVLPLVPLVVVLLGLRHLNMFVSAVFLHRSMSHGSVRFAPWLTTVFRVLAWLFVGLGATTWAAVHRCHHATTDTIDDPHSPTRPGGSLWNIGLQTAGATQRVAHDRAGARPYLGGLPDDALERFINGEERRFFGLLGVRGALVLGLPLLAFHACAGLPWGWAALATVGCFVTAVGSVLMLNFFGINGVAHLWGYRNFDGPDTSTNIVGWDPLSWGEALHHNHHSFPGRAHLAMAPGEWDPAWAVLRGMRRLGWVTKLAGA